MNFIEILNRKGNKIYYYYDLGGRGKGQRPATGIFTYKDPKNQIEKNHNKEALAILETKKSQFIIESQAIGSPYIPQHKFKKNFLDYYEEYVRLNKKVGNRHIENSFTQFKKFIKKDFIAPIEITENLCKRFRQYLLDRFNGETPLNYFARFKWVVNAAEKDRYFHSNPVEKVYATSNPSKTLKENLEADEYLALLKTPCTNEEVEAGFIFSLYTALRWVDAKRMKWPDLKDGVLVTRIIQKKTGRPVVLTLHPVALKILEKQRKKHEVNPTRDNLVFQLPSPNAANDILNEWAKSAGIDKYITWSCARLSFAILLQDERVDLATVAYLLGHTTTKQVQKTYKRHRPKPQTEAVSVLPNPVESPKVKQPDYYQSANYIYKYSVVKG